MSLFAIAPSPLDTLEADAIVVGAVPDGEGARVADGQSLPDAAKAHLDAVLPVLGATGKVDDVHSIAGVPGLAAKRVVVTGIAPGVGKDTAVTAFTLRAGAGAALRHIGKADTVVLALPVTEPGWRENALIGAHLGSYVFMAHKGAAAQESGPKEGRKVARILVHGEAANRDDDRAVERAEVIAAESAFVRDLVNSPPNALYPETFVDVVRDRIAASEAAIEIVVHGPDDLVEMGCGGIVGVGQGSEHAPRIMELHYRPDGPGAHVALVGKGITFDSGGLCIKPAASMLAMKSDMAGAAAVAGAVIAAARLGIGNAVSGYLCLAENLPSGTAQRPSDVVTMRNGLTVEIIDTDAEGRMVLGDGLALAVESGADAILDIATLTGACMVALGTRVAGVMSNDEGVNDRVFAAASAAGEAMWPLPLPEDLRGKLDSVTADLQHKGDQWGGALTAGLFLREFVNRPDGESVPWAHLDIAGPSFNEGAPYGFTSKGGTGFGMATMLAFAEAAEAAGSSPEEPA